MNEQKSPAPNQLMADTAAVVVSVLSVLFGYLAWTGRDWFFVFAWFIPLAAITFFFVIVWVVGNQSRVTIDRRFLSQCFVVASVTSLVAAWVYAFVLWEEAKHQASFRNWGMVKGIMVPGETRVYHQFIAAAAVVWACAYAEAAVSFILRPSFETFSIGAIAFFHSIGCLMYSVWPLD